MSTLPSKSASIHFERALAQATATMPKCSGPTFWTRGWTEPLGLGISWGRRDGRRGAFVAMINNLGERGQGRADSHKVVWAGAGEKNLLSGLPHPRGQDVPRTAPGPKG